MNCDASNLDAQALATDLSPARPLAADVRVDRLPLALGDGYVTSVFRFRPLAESHRLPVLYLHGIQSHPGWFATSACHLAQQGHSVYLVTRRGSGNNSDRRGDTPSAGQLLADANRACRFVLEDSLRDRLHLVGVSWGGKLLAAYLARYTLPEAASLTLLAPGLAPRVDVPLPQKLAVLWARLADPMRLFDIPLSDVGLFTDNPVMQMYLRNDPLSLRQATARFLVASRLLDRQIAHGRRGCIVAPTTLVLAEVDRIIDNHLTQQVVAGLTGGRVKVVRLAGYHTLEFEPDPSGLFNILTASLSQAEKL